MVKKSKLKNRLSMKYIFYNKQNFKMPFLTNIYIYLIYIVRTEQMLYNTSIFYYPIVFIGEI